MKWSLVSQLCLTLCDPMDCSPQGSSVHGIFQARILEWVAIPLSRGSSRPSDWTLVCSIAGRFLTIWATMVPCIHLALQSSRWVQGLAFCPQISNGSEELIFQSAQLLTYYWHRASTLKLLTCGTRNQKEQCFFLFLRFRTLSMEWNVLYFYLCFFFFRNICYILKEAYGDSSLILYIKLTVLCQSNSSSSETLVPTS